MLEFGGSPEMRRRMMMAELFGLEVPELLHLLMILGLKGSRLELLYLELSLSSLIMFWRRLIYDL